MDIPSAQLFEHDHHGIRTSVAFKTQQLVRWINGDPGSWRFPSDGLDHIAAISEEAVYYFRWSIDRVGLILMASLP